MATRTLDSPSHTETQLHIYHALEKREGGREGGRKKGREGRRERGRKKGKGGKEYRTSTQESPGSPTCGAH